MNFSRVAKSCVLFAVIFSVSVQAQAADWKFHVSFPKSVHAKPYTGRVYVIFSQQKQEPRLGPSWFRPEKFIAQEVNNLKPGEELVISSSQTKGLLSYPKPLDELDVTNHYAQAVIRFNPHARQIGKGPGNGFSDAIVIRGQGSPAASFVVNKLVPKPNFRETDWTKLFRFRSKMLSEFHGRDVYMQAAVLLPRSYFQQTKRRFPTVFNIPGFSGRHFDAIEDTPTNEDNDESVEFLRVTLDPDCPLGHHVFADSENNGPVGAALIKEFLPAFDRSFRSIPKPSARFLTGHSSGGWSSLWLQVTYPEHFGGVWSTAPDPVDFRDFQRINLYKSNENMYVDTNGKDRPLARINGNVVLWYRGFSMMEWTLGYGGQLHSFEAVFSPRGKNGKPKLIWDRQTGKVDNIVTKHWEKYDIRLILERNWETLGPKLQGKINVIMGDRDTFYLEGATILLKESLAKLGSDAVVEIVPGRDHFNLYKGGLYDRIRREMVAAFLKKHKD